MTASPAASSPASGIQADGVAGAVAGGRDELRRAAAEREWRPRVRGLDAAERQPRPAARAHDRVFPERHVIVDGEAGVALADHRARDRPRAAGRARRRGRGRRGRAASSSAVPPRWSLSGCVISTASARSPMPGEQRQQLVCRRRPGRPVSTSSTVSSPRDHDLADDARAVVLLAAPDAVGELADHALRPDGVEQSPTIPASSAPLPAARSGRGVARRTRSARSNSSSAANG